MTETAAPDVDRVDAEFVRSFAPRWLAGWNDHDVDALVGLCTDDVLWEDPALPQPERGRQAVREYLEGTWSMFPDLAFTLPEPPMLALEGPRAAQVWIMTGTMLGSDPWAGFAATGKRIDVEGIDVYEFRGGLVSRYRGRYDLAEVARQLGLAPARGSRPERVMAFVQRTTMRLRPKPKAT
ncbi:MAG: nuclear transport factor 2 family protein [Gaiellaceae bacterium]